MKNKFDSQKLLEAMEYCIDPLKETDENGECLSDICPYVGLDDTDNYTNHCEDCLMRDALAYIRYQKKKIERLKKHRTKKELEDRIEQLEQEIRCFGIIQYNVDEQATEFYKESLDKLKDYAK